MSDAVGRVLYLADRALVLASLARRLSGLGFLCNTCKNDVYYTYLSLNCNRTRRESCDVHG